MMLSSELFVIASNAPEQLARQVKARVATVNATKQQFGMKWPEPVVPTGKDQYGAIRAMYDGSAASKPAYAFPCGIGSAYALLEGIACDKAVTKDQFNDLSKGNAFENLDNFTGNRSADGVWIPGDRAHFSNVKPIEKYKDDVLHQGEYILYVGNDQFWGHLSKDVTQSYNDWKALVNKWGKAEFDPTVVYPKNGLRGGL